VGGQEALAEKCGVDAVSVVAFAYDTYTTPSKNNGVLRATLTLHLQAQVRGHCRQKQVDPIADLAFEEVSVQAEVAFHTNIP
jgi:hypothetical protein